MGLRVLISMLLVFPPVLAIAETFDNADTFLCGDPPLLADEGLKSDLQAKAQFLYQFLGDDQLPGKIEATRTEVLSSYPDADKVLADYYLLYQTCVLLIRDGSLETMQKLEKLKKMRTSFKKAFKEQVVYQKCRHKDFGLEGWASEETISQSSGWMGGGSNQTNWCNTLITKIVQGRSIGPMHKATIIDKSEQAKWTWDRKRLYSYHCTIKIQWNPIYKEKVDPRCDKM